jgi:hypothetical protein
VINNISKYRTVMNMGYRLSYRLCTPQGTVPGWGRTTGRCQPRVAGSQSPDTAATAVSCAHVCRPGHRSEAPISSPCYVSDRILPHPTVRRPPKRRMRAGPFWKRPPRRRAPHHSRLAPRARVGACMRANERARPGRPSSVPAPGPSAWQPGSLRRRCGEGQWRSSVVAQQRRLRRVDGIIATRRPVPEARSAGADRGGWTRSCGRRRMGGEGHRVQQAVREWCRERQQGERWWGGDVVIGVPESEYLEGRLGRTPRLRLAMAAGLQLRNPAGSSSSRRGLVAASPSPSPSPRRRRSIASTQPCRRPLPHAAARVSLALHGWPARPSLAIHPDPADLAGLI